jgi:hypothetical protein
MMSEITRNPLCWPDSVPRTAPYARGNPQFKQRTLFDAASFVLMEINRLNGRYWNHKDDGVIISSNLRLKQDGTPYSQQIEPADTGIAVYFTLRINRNGRIIERPIVMSCDKWRLTSDNLYAIGKDIEAQRARLRWGCTNYEQSFRGYLAIPEKCGGPSWWAVLEVESDAPRAQIDFAYKRLAKKYHPDAGGDDVRFNQLKEAYEQASAQAK